VSRLAIIDSWRQTICVVASNRLTTNRPVHKNKNYYFSIEPSAVPNPLPLANLGDPNTQVGRPLKTAQTPVDVSVASG